jgi:hypothetical protein
MNGEGGGSACAVSQREPRRRGAPDFKRFPCGWMENANTLRVKQITGVSGKSGRRFFESPPHDVQGITDERVPCSCQVDSNLVRSSCLDANLDKGRIGAPFDDGDPAQRTLPVMTDSVQRSKFWVWHLTDWRFNGEGIQGRNAARQRTVDLGYFIVSQCCAKNGSCRCSAAALPARSMGDGARPATDLFSKRGRVQSSDRPDRSRHFPACPASLFPWNDDRFGSGDQGPCARHPDSQFVPDIRIPD